MTPFTRRRPRDMEDDGGPKTQRSRREDQDSRGVTRAYQLREYEVCQERRAEF